MQTGPCLICKNVAGNRFLTVREMMFGLRDPFQYLECGNCGCLQIDGIPADPARYYPVEYYPEPPRNLGRRGIKSALRRKRAEYCLTGKGIIGRLAVNKYGRPVAGIFGRPDYLAWMQKSKVNFASRILDIGCGLGGLLIRLYNDGFSDLTGIDPFIEKSIHYTNGLEVRKQSLSEVDGQFDLVMLHHAFEHMPKPWDVLRHIRRLLRSEAYAVIRIPVASSHAYRTYGANWAQLDAPRHLFVHTLKSIQLLASDAGLRLVDVVWDSNEFQFWASEQYARDIPLRSERSYGVNPANSVFSDADIRRFRHYASELNVSGQGDSACFYLLRP